MPICADYLAIRPDLLRLIAALSGIPFIDGSVVVALKAIMAVLDVECPVAAGGAGAAPAAAIPNLGTTHVCQVYNAIKPELSVLLGIAGLFPVTAPYVAAITALTAILNQVCAA